METASDARVRSGSGSRFALDPGRGSRRASDTFAAVVIAAAAGAGAASRNVSSAAVATCQQTILSAQLPQNELNPQNHQSRRNAWIKKRWKAAFHTIRAVGTWKKPDDPKSGHRDLEPDLATTDDGVVVKKKWHTFVVHDPQQRCVCAVCGVDSTYCGEGRGDSGKYSLFGTYCSFSDVSRCRNRIARPLQEYLIGR